MTEREYREAIYGRWEDGWDALHPQDPDDPDYIPYCFDGEIDASAARFVRVEVVPSVSAQTTQGSAPSRKFQRRGVIIVQLFARPDEGTGALADMIDDVRTVLEGRRLNGLNLYAATAGNVPTDGAWQMAVVSVPFRVTEQR